MFSENLVRKDDIKWETRVLVLASCLSVPTSVTQVSLLGHRHVEISLKAALHSSVRPSGYTAMSK